MGRARHHIAPWANGRQSLRSQKAASTATFRRNLRHDMRFRTFGDSHAHESHRHRGHEGGSHARHQWPLPLGTPPVLRNHRVLARISFAHRGQLVHRPAGYFHSCVLRPPLPPSKSRSWLSGLVTSIGRIRSGQASSFPEGRGEGDKPTALPLGRLRSHFVRHPLLPAQRRCV